ncbi:hypothetical protein H4Q26_001135 [Puccinia striiformis f. sp. tritici PST-130]|nr:hypothetical protein H4Q26_001135 [Puccinia striiformis f. sp. tritici PST-130]
MASIAANFVGQGKKCIFRSHRNYLDHVKELKINYITRGQKIEIPSGINCHHEVELGVIIGNKCRSVKAQEAMKFVAGYTIAIDLTARNLQEDVKRKQLPWSSVKGFDTFCPVGKFIQAHEILDPHQLSIWLKLNGELKQHKLISYCSGIMTLEEGDLLLTGTPAGVSSISPGDEVEIGVEQETNSSIQIMDQIKFNAIQRSDGLTYDQLKI